MKTKTVVYQTVYLNDFYMNAYLIPRDMINDFLNDIVDLENGNKQITDKYSKYLISDGDELEVISDEIEIYWSIYSENYVCFCIDKDGLGYLYEAVPSINIDKGYWEAPAHSCKYVGQFDEDWAFKNWENSLIYRPK